MKRSTREAIYDVLIPVVGLTVIGGAILAVVAMLTSCELTEPDRVEVGASHTMHETGTFMDPSWRTDPGDSDALFVQVGWDFGARSRHEESIGLERERTAKLGALLDSHDTRHEDQSAVIAELRDRIRELERTAAQASAHGHEGEGDEEPSIPLWMILSGATGIAGAGVAGGRFIGRS